MFKLFILPIHKNINYSFIESFSDNKLPFIEDTDYIFIHIPKTGGTSFCKKYLKYQVSHVKAHNYDEEQLKKVLQLLEIHIQELYLVTNILEQKKHTEKN